MGGLIRNTACVVRGNDRNIQSSLRFLAALSQSCRGGLVLARLLAPNIARLNNKYEYLDIIIRINIASLNNKYE